MLKTAICFLCLLPSSSLLLTAQRAQRAQRIDYNLERLILHKNNPYSLFRLRPLLLSYNINEDNNQDSKTNYYCNANSSHVNKNHSINRQRRRFISLPTSLLLVNGLKAVIHPALATNSGVLLPDVGEIENSIPNIWDENDNPIDESNSKSQFSRLDATPDSIFYSEARFVEHVDEASVQTMTNTIAKELLNENDSVLDLCASWTSHIDVSTKENLKLKRVSGVGMNAQELSKNSVLTDWIVQDLNVKKNGGVRLPYEDATFDIVLCQLSIDYLIDPLDVMKEVGRILKPGGKVAIFFSNRLFLSKAVALWTGAGDVDHSYLVGAYLHYSRGNFENIQARDLSQRRGKKKNIIGDPLYVVTGVKQSVK